VIGSRVMSHRLLRVEPVHRGGSPFGPTVIFSHGERSSALPPAQQIALAENADDAPGRIQHRQTADTMFHHQLGIDE
jgi:hypothetical protein